MLDKPRWTFGAQIRNRAACITSATSVPIPKGIVWVKILAVTPEGVTETGITEKVIAYESWNVSR